MANWVVKLMGNEFDLNVLAKLATEPSCRVTQDRGAFYLASTEFAEVQEPGEVHALAIKTLLPHVNGLMKLRNLNSLPISLDSVVRLNADGSRTHARFVVASVLLSGNSRITVEGTIIGPDGAVVLSPEPAIFHVRFQLAQQHPEIANALRYWVACEQGDANFRVNANKVYDIIRDAMGNGNRGQGTKNIVARGWSTWDEIHDFGDAANNPAVSGDKARHGDERPQRPTSLTEGEAVAFIQRLFNAWLDEKADQSGLSVP